MLCETPTGCARNAVDVAKDVRLQAEAAGLLRTDQTAGEFLATLIQHKLRLDAVRFAPFALDTQHAIWWGALCLWEFYRSNPPQKVLDVLQAVVHWLQQPNDENRRAVHEAGRKAGAATPAGNLATAVYFSGGSISLPELPEVEPKPHMTAKNVANAVVLICKKVEPARATELESRCLLLALEVARGELHWHAADPTIDGLVAAAEAVAG